MFPKLSIVLLIVFYLLNSGDILADHELSGKIIHDSIVLTEKGIYADKATEDSKGEFTKSISRLKLNVNRTDEDGFGLFGEIWVTYDHLNSYYDQYDNNSNSGSEDLKRNNYDELFLREACVSASLGSFEFKAGKMIINWGRADEINPIDVVNPEDLSEFYSIEKMERKIPLLLFQSLLYLGDFTLEAVWIPFFEPARVPARGPWAQKSFIELREQLSLFPDLFDSLDFSAKDHEGKRDIMNSETAGRFSGLLGSFDFGFVFFYGYNDLPALNFGIDSATRPYLTATYRRYHGYGFDFACSSGGCGFRGEALYRDRVLYHLQPTRFELTNYKTPDVQSILGVDKTFGENFYINLQVIYNRILDYKEEIVAAKDALMGSGTIEDKFFDNELKAAIDFYYVFNDKDWWIEPYLEYSLTENLFVKAGYFFIDGHEDGDIGQFKENDMAYINLSYAF